ncbi:MAG TPA: hypothetical protein EYG51_16705 [Pseudomonadales bacterium]|nr:hypothetical protein [Pseudomonadales bacterium]
MTIFSFIFCLFPTAAIAQDDSNFDPTASIDLISCELLGTPKLQLVLPSIGSTGKIYDVGSTSTRYRLWDTTTNSVVDVQGTLFDRHAAASLLVGLQSVEELWQLELKRVISYNNACWQYRLSLKGAEVRSRDARIETISKEMSERLLIKDDQINFLSENYMPIAWYETGEFWFGTGLVAGIALTIGAGYALHLVGGQ